MWDGTQLDRDHTFNGSPLPAYINASADGYANSVADGGRDH